MILKDFQPIPAATGFYNKKKTIGLGVGFDERIPMLEDWPRWIRLLEKGVRFGFVDKVLVKYRISNDSICSGTKYRDKFREALALLFIYYQYEPYKKMVGRLKAWSLYSYNKVVVSGKWYWKLICVGFRVAAFPKRIIRRIVQ